MALKNGSDEYWKIKEQAERIYRKKANARSSSEREEWAERGKEMADRLREDFGYRDECVKYLIKEFDLDRD